MARQLIVELLANTDKFKGPLDKATKQTETFGQKAKKAAKVAGPAIAGIGVAMSALSGPLDQSNAQLEQMVKNSENVTETQISKWADDNRRSFQLSGISIAEQNAALSEAIGLGLDWDTTARIMATANDLSAATGISLKEAIAQIGRASDGSGKLIDKFGLDVDNVDELLAGLNERVGGVSAELDKTFSGRVKGVTTIMKDWAAQIGVIAGPLLTALGGALTSLPFLITGVTKAVAGLRVGLTFLAAHPVFLAILAGGAIIAGLVLLEKKFGIISSAVETVTDALKALWRFFKRLPRLIADKAGDIASSIAGMIPGSGIIGSIAGGLGKLNPFHAGGVVPGNPGQVVPILARAGETVTPRGGGAGGIVINVSGVGMGRDFGDAVARALRDNKLIGVSI